MNTAMKNILHEDFAEILERTTAVDMLRGSTVLITGATGLVGSLLVRFLLTCNDEESAGIRVIALVRSPEKARGIFEELCHREDLSFCCHDLGGSEPVQCGHVDYIIHTAAITKSAFMVKYPVDTIKASVNGTRQILDFAVETGAKGVVYISSMEVYGQMNTSTPVVESDLGYVDLSTVRACYPEGKRICECMCKAYSAQYGLRVMTARLAQTFGAGILPEENRVFAQFARSARSGSNIVLHTTGESEGNYVYTAEAIQGILTILEKGVPGEAYNVSNEASHVTIRAMAELVAREVAGGSIQVCIEIPEDVEKLGYAPPTRMHLCSRKLQSLGWEPRVGLTEAYRRMIRWMDAQEG